jgi:hypothetical protein
VKLIFNNSYSDSDTEVGHTRSGRPFREVPLVNLFNKKYGDDEFYSGEEADLIDEEHSESAQTEEVQTEELHRGEPETSSTEPTIKVSNITPLVVLEESRNHSNQSSQSNKSTVTRRLPHTQSKIQGRSMADEMRLQIFRGDGSEDLDQH